LAADLPEPKTDMTPYTELLEQHCDKLEAVESDLYDCLEKITLENVNTVEDLGVWLKAHELWLTAQNQLRLTAQSLNSAAKPKPRLAS
jgi:hypothetical protein